MHVKASIYEVYIVEEISTFISFYFESHLRTRIYYVPRHDDSGKVLSSGNFSIFFHAEWLVPKKPVSGRYLTEIKLRYVHNYVLFNCNELRHFIQ